MTRHCTLVFILLLVAESAHADDAQQQAALAACRQMDDARRPGSCYLLYGLADAASRKSDAVRLHLEEAARRFEAAGDPVAAWKAFYLLAQYEDRFDRQVELRIAAREKALAVVERAKRSDAPFRPDPTELGAILRGAPLAQSSIKPFVLQFLEAVSRDAYAAALLNVGELEKAETQLGIASQLAGPFGAMLDRSIARNVGHLRRRQWRLDEARESYRKALAAPKIRLPLTVDDRQEGDVGALYGLAEIEMLGGRTEQALAWNDRALALARTAGEGQAELSLLRHRATILERGGRVAAAEQVYANALSIAKAHGDVKEEATLLTNRASLYMNRGRYGAAIADSEKALELIVAIDDPLLESALLASVAGTYLSFGAGDGATSAIEKARALVEKSGSRLVDSLLDVIIAFRTGTPAEFNEALERFLQRPEVRGMQEMPQLAALLRAMVGPSPGAGMNAVDGRERVLEGGLSELVAMMTLFEQGRFAAARDVAMRALALDPSAELRANLLAMIAVTYAEEGQIQQCIEYARKASDAFDAALDAVTANDLLGGFLGERRALFDMLIDILALTGRPGEAFEVAERARARAFLQLVGNRPIRARKDGDSHLVREAEALRAQIAQWQQQARLAPSKQLDDDLRGARRRYEGLRTRVQASDPEYSAMTNVEAAPLEAIRAEIPPATTLISYFISRTMVHAWVLDRTSVEHVSLPVNDAWLESARCATQRWGEGGRGVRVRDSSCDAVTVEELYERLFLPLRDHVRNQRLVIVPHGVLHYLPFGALRDPRTRRYLIEDYTITYMPSGSSIRFLRDKETPVDGKALVIGAPAGVSPALPGAMREAMMVGSELQTMPMVGAAAQESLLYRLKGEVDLVHIAAHGFYEAETPLFSRLALAEGDGSDGNLEVHEILSELDLRGVNLVVLSACSTARGKGNPGDEVVGLTRALLYAGTPGVISTLWDIGDHAAAALMTHFYCRLLSGASAAEALRYAQLQLLRGDYPDPRQWAAFTLHGDPEGRWNASGAITAAAQ